MAAIRNVHVAVPIYDPSTTIEVLRAILSEEPQDNRRPFSRSELSNTNRVSVWLHTTPETEAEIMELVVRLKAMVAERGKRADGTTVGEVYVRDQTTGHKL